MMAKGGGTSVATWAFDPTHKNSAAVLTNSNLTLTSSSSYGLVLGTAAVSGKKFYSATLNTPSTLGETGFGISNYSQSLSGGAFLGGSVDSLSLFDDGSWWTSSGNQGSALSASFTAGAVLDVAMDTAAQKIWFRVNNGNWNSALNSGTDNPATGAGGINISTVAGPIYAAANVFHNGSVSSQWTVNATTPYTLPSGFSYL